MNSFYLKPKFVEIIKEYTGSQLVSDIVAGIIVAIIALPLSIALALASGVQPAQGIYTAIAAGFFVALLGGSRVQIAGPTAAFATTVAGIVATSGMDGLIIATVLAGIMLILMGIFKLGGLIRFIPTAITVGFTGGIAVTIFIGQIKDFLGITYAESVKPIETIEKIKANIDAIFTFNWQSLIIGAICLLVLVFYPKIEKRIPPSLIAVVVGAVLTALIPALNDGVYTIGDLYDIPKGLPQINFADMDFSTDKIITLLPSAFTIAILAGIESLLSCVVSDSMIKDKHNPNAELLAQGVANIASVLFGGIPATGAIARTAANIKNGGRTPVSAMVHSAVLLLVLVLLMPFAKLIPMPTIAAILFIVAYNMSEWRHFVRIIKKRRIGEILILLVTFVFTVVFDLVVAIVVGMVLYGIISIIKIITKKGDVEN
ncbi:MAG: sodium-independent anion transporter [Ruminococcaceae bacterium]|nr:sodium-independent anion transporter [Oscillospiraceae bacterium]